MFDKSCDTMVALPSATAHGQTLFAKNSDRPADECQPLELHARIDKTTSTETHCQFVTLPEADVVYRHVGSRPWWCWGYEHGFNEHQVVIGNEGLGSKFEPWTESKLVGMEILRLGLERGKTAREAVDVMTGVITEYGQGKFDNDAGVRTYDNGYIVADPKEAYVIETAGHQWVVKRVEDAIGISNVYSVETDYDEVSPGAEAIAREKGWWQGDGTFNFADAFSKADRTEGSGASRRKRSCALLSARSGKIDPRSMMATLSDHSDAVQPDEEYQTDLRQGGICVHFNEDGTGGNTAASLVADLCNDGSRLPVYWCSFYSPCLGLFLPIFIEGTLPGALAVGGEEPSVESTWWQFHRLAHLVREDTENRVGLVRNQWAMQQRACFSGAYAVAEEGKRLLDNGSTDDAEDMLTSFMEDSVSQMLEATDELIAFFADEPVSV
jgi:dipeptidase